jgi:hypothetical protein
MSPLAAWRPVRGIRADEHSQKNLIHRPGPWYLNSSPDLRAIASPVSRLRGGAPLPRLLRRGACITMGAAWKRKEKKKKKKDHLYALLEGTNNVFLGNEAFLSGCPVLSILPLVGPPSSHPALYDIYIS